MQRRRQYKDLISTNANLPYDRYWRLIALASVDFCLTVPLSIRAIVTGALSGVSPWVSWEDTHREYSHVVQIPRMVLDRSPVTVSSYEITRWTSVLCAFLFFGFFGFTDEARRNYRELATTIAKFFGFTLCTGVTASTSGPRVIDHSLRFALPVSTAQQTVSGRDSDSFSDGFSEVQFHPPAKMLTSTSSMSLSVDESTRVPEPVLDPALVRRSFVPDGPPPVHPGNAQDRA